MIDIVDNSRAADNLEARSAYAKRLAAVLGNGAEWSYRGEVDEAPGNGICACGHTGLRYLFPIYHPDGRRVIVGSSCIETYAAVNPAMVAGIQAAADEARRAHDEKIRAAKRAAKDLIVQAAAAECAAKKKRIFEIIAAKQFGAWISGGAWKVCSNVDSARRKLAEGTPFSVSIPPLKTAAGQLKRLQSLGRDYDRMIEALLK